MRTEETAGTELSRKAARKGPLRRLYDWVLHWADTPYGTPALFILAFTESSFFPIPPDPLLIALTLGEQKKAYRFAAWCSVASVLGGAAGYLIGATIWSVVDSFFYAWVPSFTPQSFERVGGSTSSIISGWCSRPVSPRFPTS